MPLSNALEARYAVHDISIVTSAETPGLARALDDLLRPFAVQRADNMRYTAHADLKIEVSAAMLPVAIPAYTTIWLEYGPLRGTIVANDRYLEYDRCIAARYLPAELRIEVGIPPHWGVSTWMAGHAVIFPLLVEALREHGLFALHAAALAKDGRVALFPAESGSGKTTLALALLREGFDLLSDDAPLMRWQADSVEIANFPEPLNVTRQTGAFFPEVAARWRDGKPDARGKVSVDVEALYGTPAVASGTPGAVIFPSVGTDQHTALKPLAKSAALLRLAALAMPTATAELAHEQFTLLARLVERTPCYTMRVGRDFPALPEVIGRLLGVNGAEDDEV